jgi:iron-sulfur cluster assembly protein
MKVILAGSRHLKRKHRHFIQVAVDLSGFDITEVVSGRNGKRNAKGEVVSGTDLLGEEWAEDHNLPIDPYPADWTKYGKGAGPIRNGVMARDSGAEGLIALWDGKSTGTKNMIEQAEAAGLEVSVYLLNGPRMLTLTERARAKVRELLELNDMPSEAGVKLGVKAGGCSGLSYTLDLVEGPEENDRVFDNEGVLIYCAPKPYLYLKGTEVDYLDAMTGGGFQFNNPNARRSCGCGTSFTA